MFSKSHQAQGELISPPLPVLFLLLRYFPYLNDFVQMIPSVFFRKKSVKVSTGQSHPRAGSFSELKTRIFISLQLLPINLGKTKSNYIWGLEKLSLKRHWASQLFNAVDCIFLFCVP